MIISSILGTFWHNQSFGQLIEIDGKNYQFSQIYSQNILERLGDKGKVTQVRNPFDKKSVKMVFVPGWTWRETYRYTLAQKVWPLYRMDFTFSIASDNDPFYILKAGLMASEKTPYGIIRFEIHNVSYKRHENLTALKQVFDVVVSATEEQKRKRQHELVCVEMTGELYLSSTVQRKDYVRDLKNASVTFIFAPQSAKIVSCTQ